MGRLSLVWRILTSGQFAQQLEKLLQAGNQPVPQLEHSSKPAPTPSAVVAVPEIPKRSEAVTLLSTLQREGRFIDFLKEPITDYSDAQVGAAVRDIHRDCAAVLERQFAIRPVVEQAEGSRITVGSQPDPGKFRLSGQVGEDQPDYGNLVHAGWRITRRELPQWSGSLSAAEIIAPVEVELRRERTPQ